MKIFKRYPFTEDEESQNEKASFYYKVLPRVGFEIVENIFNDKISSVIYRKLHDFDIESIQEYHKINYSELELFQIEETLSENVFKMTAYYEGKGFRFYIFHLDEQGRVQKQHEYDSNYNLLQFQEDFYIEGERAETKIFYPSSWNISRDKLT